MAIDIRLIVDVTPSILSPGGQDLELNGMLLSRSDRIPASPTYRNMLQFASPEMVADYFGPESDEYAAAVHYFSGYSNSFKKPRRLYVALYPDRDAAAWLRGAEVEDDLAAFKAVAAGELEAVFSGVAAAITPVNLSAAASYSEIAAIVQEALRQAAPNGNAEAEGATVEYDSDFKAFVVRAGGPGAAGQTLAVGDSGLAALMRLDAGSSPTASNGVSAMARTEILDGIRETTANWATFLTVWDNDVDEAIGFARWASTFAVRFLAVMHNADAQTCVDIADALAGLNLDAAVAYGDARYAAFISGIAASVDYNREQGAVTYAHKYQAGLPYNVVDTAQAQIFVDHGVNFYGSYALNNNEFVFLYPGRTLGEWRWIDHFINGVWFYEALKLSAMQTLRSTPRIPYNQRGLGYIHAGYKSPINRAVLNGVIDVGLELTESQTATVIREAGKNIASDLFMYGFHLQIRLPAPEVRVTRDSTVNTLWYCYAGSVHRLELAARSIV